MCVIMGSPKRHKGGGSGVVIVKVTRSKQGEKVLGKIHSKNEFVVIDDLYISFKNYNKPVSYA